MPQVRLQRPYQLSMLLSIVVLCSGCLPADEATVTAALPLDDVLPATWTPLGDVQPVNIDGDSASEYLLFFTYDSNGGPVGAVIYNPENDGRFSQPIPEQPASEQPTPQQTAEGESIDGVPNGSPVNRDTLGANDTPVASINRPASSLVPYPILPSYRPGAGQGFIAESAQAGVISVYPLTLGPTTATTPNEPTPRQADALAILGGANYLTLVWWQRPQHEYGVTQLYAPAYFEAALFTPFDWESWRASPQFINEIIAVHPLHDRSLLCRRKRYTLVSPVATSGIDINALVAGSTAVVENILYHEMDMGLNFCNGAPVTPFYPEAVTLAYLTTGSASLLDAQLPADAVNAIEQRVARSAIVRINDLASYQTISYAPSSPFPANTANTSATNSRGVINNDSYTTACAEVLLPGHYVGLDAQAVYAPDVIVADAADTPKDSTGRTVFAKRWLLFTLHHVPPQLEPPSADQLYITNVEAIPVPNDQIAVNCKEWLSR
ncbi:MAG: hypothetical protein R2867_02910 [Caldilineaceae bacterium]